MSLADRKRSERNRRERRQQIVRDAMARRLLTGEFDTVIMIHDPGSLVGQMGFLWRWRCRKMSNTEARRVAQAFVHNEAHSLIAQRLKPPEDWNGFEQSATFLDRLACLQDFIRWFTGKKSTYHGKRALRCP